MTTSSPNTSMATIFLDESGYSGEDLLNPEQPILVLATHDYSEEESNKYKEQFFSRVRADELKFSRLAARESRQQMVLDFLKQLFTDRSRVGIAVCHKRFALEGKIVDVLIETFWDDHDADLYADNLHVAIANVIHYAFPLILGESTLDEILRRFQRMMRTGEREDVANFYRIFDLISFPNEVRPILEWISESRRYVDGIFTTDHHLDVTVSLNLALMRDWRKRIVGDIRLIHDVSSSMAREARVWEALTRPEDELEQSRATAESSIWPIDITETVAANSRDWVGLQLADILAGTTAQWVRRLSDGSSSNSTFADRLMAVFPDDLPGNHLIWPGQSLETYSEDHTRVDPRTSLEQIIQRLWRLRD